MVTLDWRGGAGGCVVVEVVVDVVVVDVVVVDVVVDAGGVVVVVVEGGGTVVVVLVAGAVVVVVVTGASCGDAHPISDSSNTKQQNRKCYPPGRMLRGLVLLSFLFTTLAATAADAERGASLYKSKTCVTCHAADGSGSTPAGKSLKARDLRSEDVQSQSDDALAKTIAHGKGKMPSFKKMLSETDVADLVAHLRALRK